MRDITTKAVMPLGVLHVLSQQLQRRCGHFSIFQTLRPHCLKIEKNEKPPRKEQNQEDYKRKSQQNAKITTLKKVKNSHEPKLDSEDKKSTILFYPIDVKSEKDGHSKYESSTKECEDIKNIIKPKTAKIETDHSKYSCMGDNLVAYLSRFVKKEPNFLMSEKTV